MPINKVQTGDLLTSTKWNELVTELNKKEKLSEDTFSGALTITESLHAKNATVMESLTVTNASGTGKLTVDTLTVKTLTVTNPDKSAMLTSDSLMVSGKTQLDGEITIQGIHFTTDIINKMTASTAWSNLDSRINSVGQIATEVKNSLDSKANTSHQTFFGTTTVDNLYVSGYIYRELSFAFFNKNDNTGKSSGNLPYSIYAEQRIAGSEFNAHSDARIKQKLRISNSKEDLATLMQLKVTDYTMIDTVSNGNRVSKKLIAQEVAAVYPNAVSYTTGFIPNIYQIAQIENGFVTLSNPDLTIGDKVRLIFQEQQLEVRVTEITENGFSVLADPPKSKLPNGRVFVFGKEVHDFHSLDYDAITMLNVSATQALVKQLHGLESQHADLKADFEALEKQLQSFKAETILNS